MILLMATLFWALWDEGVGQRPWKAFQQEWKDRYGAFLKTAKSSSAQSEKEIEQSPEYQKLAQTAKDAEAVSRPRREEIQKQITNLSAQILSVQNVFTDRRAYVNALTYQLETDTSASGKKSKQKKIDEYKARQATVEFPDRHKEKLDFHQLEGRYNDLKAERSKLSAELGEVLKPASDASTALSAYLTDHMVDLKPEQIEGLRKKTSELDPAIVQINIPEANIVDRCESCHMGAREPVRISEAAMRVRGRSPTSTPAPLPAIPSLNY